MIEKRHYPRINLKAPILVKLKNGEELLVDLDNISSSGLQLVCGRDAESQITPNGQWDPAELMVEIQLPGLEAEAAQKFEARCVVVTSRRVSFDDFYIGLRFTDFIGDSYSILGKSIGLEGE
jgi:hypothetical protein